jgi:hypothetical protein
MLFLNGSSFEQYSVGLGFVRTFKNTNVTSDTAQFTEDLNALWLPAFTTDAAYSSWTSFLYSLDQGAIVAGPFLLLVASIIVLAGLAYRATLSDERLDRFLTLASAQPKEHRSCLSRLLNRTRRTATGDELATVAESPNESDVDLVDSSLRELERRHLVRRSLVERGADVVSVWRPAF